MINNDGAKGSAICAVGAPWVRIGGSQLLCGESGLHALASSVLITDSKVQPMHRTTLHCIGFISE